MKRIHLILFSTSFLLAGCSVAQKQAKQDGFLMLSSTFQNWAGGAAGSGTGTYYNFNMVIKTNKELQFDSVWIKDQALTLKVKRKPFQEKKPFAKNDTVTIGAEIHKPGRMKEMTREKDGQPKGGNRIKEEALRKTPPPFAFKGMALIKYRLDGVVKYKEIEVMKKLPFLAYP